MSNVQHAIELRNQKWSNNDKIPSWVDINTVGLDQFFTRPEVAKECVGHLHSVMLANASDPSLFTYVEPSVGDGAFYDKLPEYRRLGIDIDPRRKDFLQADFLSWLPGEFRKPVAMVGNPPFGYRAWLALAFMNHAAKFADYVGFILPMAFQSDGKGSPKFRVQGLQLVETKLLPPDSFVSPSGKSVKVNAIWQVWKKGENIKLLAPKCDQWIDLFTVDQRKERLCGHERMHEADFFLQRTFYNQPPNLVTKFEDVKYVCGYGLVLKKKRSEIEAALRDVDWNKYSNLAAHNCRHISMYHIRRALTDLGYTDD